MGISSLTEHAAIVPVANETLSYTDYGKGSVFTAHPLRVIRDRLEALAEEFTWLSPRNSTLSRMTRSERAGLRPVVNASSIYTY